MRRKFNWNPDRPLPERVERLQTIAQEHEDRVADLANMLHEEKTTRWDDVKNLRSELETIRTETEKRIAETATAGLDRDALGLTLFIIGLGFQTWGSVGL